MRTIPEQSKLTPGFYEADRARFGVLANFQRFPKAIVARLLGQSGNVYNRFMIVDFYAAGIG
jgi:hypothetical protein